MTSKGLTNLDDTSFNRLQEILERFEKDSHRSTAKDWSKYVPPVGDPMRRIVLEELIRTDLELRWKQRKSTHLESYLKLYPEINDADSVPSLMAEEFDIRRRISEQPKFAEFEKRFPNYYPTFLEIVGAGAEQSPVRNPDFVARRSPTSTLTPLSFGDSVGGSIGDTGFPFAGKFKKIRRIGAGATGEVWEARGPGGVPVAIKRIFGAVSLRAIQRERESLDLICSGRLRHPFLLQIFGWWVQEDMLHIAMELADDNLDNRLSQVLDQRRKALEPGELLQFMIDGADALDFLNHDRNILHRDVKPANMLIMANRLKLGDFGLSRMTENLAIHMGRTMGAGTPVFIAPEIIAGFQNLHSDQYSLATSYYYLRTGKPIFTGKAPEIREKHLNSVPTFDDTPLSPGEKRVLSRALAKIPEQRYPNSATFVADLCQATGKELARRPDVIQSPLSAAGPPGANLLKGQANAAFSAGRSAGNSPELAKENQPSDPLQTAPIAGPSQDRFDETFVEQTLPLVEPSLLAKTEKTEIGVRAPANRAAPNLIPPSSLQTEHMDRSSSFELIPKSEFDVPIGKMTFPTPEPAPSRAANRSTQGWQPLNRSSLSTDLFKTAIPEIDRKPTKSPYLIYSILVGIGIALAATVIFLVQWMMNR